MHFFADPLQVWPWLQCCLSWKNMRAQKGKRMTKEVVTTLASNGAIDPAALDAALGEFGMAFSIQSKISQRKMEITQDGLTAEQLSSIMRRTVEEVK
jgi:hypothetical protein